MLTMANGKDKRAPMASAPMQYRENGEVAWGEMWESFCALALDGGPPHRGELLTAQPLPETHSPTYMQRAPLILLAPALAIFSTALSVTLIGQGLTQHFDLRQRTGGA